MSTVFCPACGAEYSGSVWECPECFVPLVDRHGDGEPRGGVVEDQDDEVVYELDDWEPDLLEDLQSRLARHGIHHSWEDNRNLVVREADSERVEALLDEVEQSRDADVASYDDDGDDFDDDTDNGSIDDEEGYTAMSDLFVAADRLVHAPSEPAQTKDLIRAVSAMEAIAAPYGLSPEEWARIRGLAAAVRDDLTGGAEDDVIVGDAKGLREVLRRYV